MNPTESFCREAISFIPITEYEFINKEQLDAKLDHGFKDIPFFPTWNEFLSRSQGENIAYPNYMTFYYVTQIRNKFLV
jgi:hypothetical protein